MWADLQKWDEICLYSPWTFCQGVIRSFLCGGMHSHKDGEQSVVSVPSNSYLDEGGAEENVGGCAWYRGAIWGFAKPKIKMTALTRADAKQIYPTDASHKLNNPCRVYLCEMCVCMCMSLWMHVCVWCTVPYVRLLTRSRGLSVKLDRWLQAGVHTWHHSCLRLRWIIAHVRQIEGLENNIWGGTGIKITECGNCRISCFMCA